MARPVKQRFKFQYANEIVGVFVLLAALSVVVALLAVSRSKKWTEPTRHLSIKLPQTSLGMREGALVKLAGMPIGIVTAIHVDELAQMTADVTLKGDYIRFIRNDSTVTVKYTFMLSGEPYLEFTLGQGIDVEDGYDKFVAVSDPEVSAFVNELRGNLTESRTLLAAINSPNGSIQQTLANLKQITGTVARGEGVAGRLLTNSQTATDFDKLLPQVNSTLAELNTMVKDLRKTTAALSELAAVETKQIPALMDDTRKTLDGMKVVLEDLRNTTAKLPDVVVSTNAVLNDVHKTTDKLPQVMESVQTSLAGLPPLLLQVQETMRQTQRLAEGMQRNWLLSGSVAPDTVGKHIRPEDVGGGGQ